MSERSLAALTGLPRTKWAEVMQKHLSSGINQDNMEIMKKAFFNVNILLKIIYNIIVFFRTFKDF